MKENRREFLRKALKIGTVAGAGVAATTLMAKEKPAVQSSGVVSGKAKKKEILYSKTQIWEKYYSIAY